MSSRKEFVYLAKQEGANIHTLCRHLVLPENGV